MKCKNDIIQDESPTPLLQLLRTAPSITGFYRAITFGFLTAVLFLFSAPVLADNCPAEIAPRFGDRASIYNLSSNDVTQELIQTGAKVCTPWSPWGLYADECRVLTARMRSRNCSRTDVYREKHTCYYVRHLAFPQGGPANYKTEHWHNDKYNKVENWVEEDFDYAFGSWEHIFATIPTLRDAVTAITTGRERTVDYTDKRATSVVGSPFSIVRDPRLPPEIASLKYFIDGREVSAGKSATLSDLGDRTATVELRTKSGGLVKFVVPFRVIKPVTVAETTQRTLRGGETQYDIKIKNNNMVHASLAWVSVSPFNRAGYAADLKGPKKYLLPPGESAVVSVLARPSEIGQSGPGVFDFIVSSPTANGAVVDKTTLTVDQGVATSSADTATLSGVVTLEMKPDNAQPVNLTLPADVRPGDTISFSAETQDTATLSGAVLDVGGKEHKLRDRILTVVVPQAVGAALPIILKNSSGREIGRQQIAINKNAGTHSANVTPPRIGQTGQVVSVPTGKIGRYDGIAGNTRVTFTPYTPQATPTNIPVVAESPHGTFARVPANAPTGGGTMTVQENGVTEQFKLNVMKIVATADDSIIQRGRKTGIHFEISGGQGVVDDGHQVILYLKNLSLSVARFNSTPSDTITTKLTLDNNGVGRFSETLIGVNPGAFTINGLLKAVFGDEPTDPLGWVRKIAELKRKAANQSENSKNQKELRKDADSLDKTADKKDNWDKDGKPKDKEKFKKFLEKEKKALDEMQKRETKDSEAWKKIGEAKDAVDKAAEAAGVKLD